MKSCRLLKKGLTTRSVKNAHDVKALPRLVPILDRRPILFILDEKLKKSSMSHTWKQRDFIRFRNPNVCDSDWLTQSVRPIFKKKWSQNCYFWLYFVSLPWDYHQKFILNMRRPRKIMTEKFLPKQIFLSLNLWVPKIFRPPNFWRRLDPPYNPLIFIFKSMLP